jgi:hypothetical protein
MSNQPNQKEAQESKTIKVKLFQKPHSQDFPYYSGDGVYFGILFKQVGLELVTEGDEAALKSLIDAKKVIKLSANAYKELLDELEEK